VHTGFWWGNLRKTDHLEDLGVDGKNIKIDFKEIGSDGVDWIDMDTYRLRAVVKTVMNLQVP
jgi:hypothetical protein